METLAHRVTSFFVKYGGATEEDRDIYEYGIMLALSTAINIFITVGVGIIASIPLQLIIYIIPFILLRSAIGGYHAETFLGCVAASSFFVVAVVILVRCIADSTALILTFIFSIISVGIIVLLAPVIGSNKKNDFEYIRKLKRRSITFAIVGVIIEMAFFSMNKGDFAFCISIGMLSASVTLLPSLFMQHD